MVRVISTVLNDPFVDGVSLQLLCFEVMNLMTREAQDVSSASGTRDGVCSDQARPLVKGLCAICSFQDPWLDWVRVLSEELLSCPHHTEKWVCAMLNIHSCGMHCTLVFTSIISLINLQTKNLVPRKISWSTREMVYDKHTCLWIRRISKTRILLQLNLFQTEYWYT